MKKLFPGLVSDLEPLHKTILLATMMVCIAMILGVVAWRAFGSTTPDQAAGIAQSDRTGPFPSPGMQIDRTGPFPSPGSSQTASSGTPVCYPPTSVMVMGRCLTPEDAASRQTQNQLSSTSSERGVSTAGGVATSSQSGRALVASKGSASSELFSSPHLSPVEWSSDSFVQLRNLLLLAMGFLPYFIAFSIAVIVYSNFTDSFHPLKTALTGGFLMAAAGVLMMYHGIQAEGTLDVVNGVFKGHLKTGSAGVFVFVLAIGIIVLALIKLAPKRD